MTKLKLGIISAAVAVGVGTPLVLQQQAASRLRNENQSLRRQLSDLATLKSENERLAQLAAQAKDAQTQADEKTSQVLKLRNEVAALRKQTNDVSRLQSENRRLQASLNARQNQPAKNSSDAAAQTEFPRENWTFAGYSTPEAAAQTMAWSAINGDISTITNSVSPEMLRMIQQLEAAGKFESEFLAGMRQDIDGINSFKIVGRETLPDDQIKLTVTIPGKEERNPVLKKIGNEWKFVKFN